MLVVGFNTSVYTINLHYNMRHLGRRMPIAATELVSQVVTM